MEPAHVNGSNEHAKKNPEVMHDDDKPLLDLEGKHDYDKTLLEPEVKDEHDKRLLDVEVKHGYDKGLLEPEVKQGDDKPLLDLEVKHENDKSLLQPEVKHGDDKPLPVEHSPDLTSPSSVSSSSSSSLEYEIDEKDNLDDGNLSSGPDYVSSPDINNQTSQWSMMSTSPRATMFSSTDMSSDWSTFGASQTKSPQVQTMGRPSGYDPNRIPASIFSSRPTNPSEWSVASNESLFSIHMGNNSFSRDHFIMFGKPGDPGFDDWTSPPSNLPPVMEVPSHEESSVRSRKDFTLEKEDSDKSLKHSSERTSEDHGKETTASAEIVRSSSDAANATVPGDNSNPPAQSTLHSSSTPRTSLSNARLSESSGHSGSSFAFPVLVDDSGKTSSLKAVSENMEKPSPKARETTGWFSCFSCWPRCC